MTDDEFDAPSIAAQLPTGWPRASISDSCLGWTLDYKFLEKVEQLAKSRTEYSTSMEATEQVLIAALEVLAAATKAAPAAQGDALDAARYRRLRECNSGSLVVAQITGTGEEDWHVLTERDADEAIDAEINAARAAKEAASA